MPDYQQGKIYGIRGGDEWYIGSTTMNINERFSHHKSKYKYCKDTYKITSFILFDTYGVDCCSIELIELYPCNSKTELFERERHYIVNRMCVNKLKPNFNDERRTTYRINYNKQYRKNHRDELNLHSSQYRKDNKDKIEALQAQKVECECGKKVRRDYLKKHQQRHK